MISQGTGSEMSSFGTDQAGELFIVSYSPSASIYRFNAQSSLGISVPGAALTRFRLLQNYPNPFNPSTLIAYDIPAAGRVTLGVFNLLGQRVATLVDAVQAAGTHEVRFDASGLPSGMYVCRITTGAGSLARGMTVVR